jgi:hypothetical protein
MDARGGGGVLRRLQWRMEERPAVQAELAREEASVPHRHSSSIDSSVKQNAAQHRFERPLHDGSFAAAYYRDADGGLVFIHTKCQRRFPGKASRLIWRAAPSSCFVNRNAKQS